MDFWVIELLRLRLCISIPGEVDIHSPTFAERGVFFRRGSQMLLSVSQGGEHPCLETCVRSAPSTEVVA